MPDESTPSPGATVRVGGGPAKSGPVAAVVEYLFGFCTPAELQEFKVEGIGRAQRGCPVETHVLGEGGE